MVLKGMIGTMNVLIGKNAGFCYGVKNAVENAKNDIENSDGNLFFLGEIVHNQQVIEEFKQSGAIFIDDITQATRNSCNSCSRSCKRDVRFSPKKQHFVKRLYLSKRS